MDKEVRKLVTQLQRIPDVGVEQGGSGHLLVSKGGAFVTTLPSTPSDHRWKDNALAQLRRVGITPGSRPRKRQAGPPKVKQMDVRAELQPIRAGRQVAAFARFAQQLGEIRGMRTWASVASAETTIGVVARGGGMAAWGWELTMAALVEWRRRLPEPQPETHVAESRPVEQSAGMKLVVDLGRLQAKLAEFGIQLEVQ